MFSGFNFSAQPFTANYNFLQPGDLNGDGKSDLIVYNSSSGLAYALISTGSVFNGYSLFLSAGYTQVQVADVTGDGIADLLVYANASGAGYLRPGQGDGTFGSATGLGWSPGYDYVERRDLNGDGRMDFVLYNSISGTEYSAVSLGGSQGFSYTYNLWYRQSVVVPWDGEWNAGAIGSPPVVTCSASPNPGLVGQAVTFTAAPSGGTPGYSYFWSGAVTGTGQTASFTPSTTGSFTASVVVTDSAGRASQPAQCSVSVQQGPTFTLSTPAAQLLTAGGSAMFSETITPQNGFNSSVTLSWMNQSSWPSGLTATFSQNATTSATTVTVSTTSSTPAGMYTLMLSGSGGGATAPTVSITADVCPGPSDWQPYAGGALIGLDTGDTYVYFTAFSGGATKDAWTNQVLNATASAPLGYVWGKTSGQQTTGGTPSEVSFPDFLLSDNNDGFGFGYYSFDFQPYFSWSGGCYWTEDIPSTIDYPAPSLTKISPAEGAPGATVNVTLSGSGLGVEDLDVSKYRGVTSVDISPSGPTASFTPADVVTNIDGTIQVTAIALPATVNVPSTTSPGTYNITVTALGYTSNALPFTVADRTPQITGVQLSQPLSPGGNAYASLYGTNFGASGQVNICNTGANPCNGTQDITASITYWNCVSPSNCQVNVYLSASSSASGTYDIQLTSNGGSGLGFIAAPDGTTQKQSNRAQIQVNCPTAVSVIITSKPMMLNGAIPDPGFPYRATLTASGAPTGGTYTWTTDNPNMIQFDNPSASTVNVTVSTSGKAQITVSYTNSCGAMSQDSLTFVLTADITVVGWIDATTIPLPSGASPALISGLNAGATCYLILLDWQTAGSNPGYTPMTIPVTSTVDRQYASAWLNIASANPQPPGTINPAAFDTNKNAFRTLNRVKAYYNVLSLGIDPNSAVYLQSIAHMGNTPEPCTGKQIFGADTEAHQLNGHQDFGPGTGPPSFMYQLGEGRLGSAGQQVNAYLNQPQDRGVYSFMSTPYTWSAIQFDTTGTLRPLVQGTLSGPSTNTLQMYPRYYLYRNGSVTNTFPVDYQHFVPLDWTSYYVLP